MKHTYVLSPLYKPRNCVSESLRNLLKATQPESGRWELKSRLVRLQTRTLPSVPWCGLTCDLHQCELPNFCIWLAHIAPDGTRTSMNSTSWCHGYGPLQKSLYRHLYLHHSLAPQAEGALLNYSHFTDKHTEALRHWEIWKGKRLLSRRHLSGEGARCQVAPGSMSRKAFSPGRVSHLA